MAPMMKETWATDRQNYVNIGGQQDKREYCAWPGGHMTAWKSEESCVTIEMAPAPAQPQWGMKTQTFLSFEARIVIPIG